MDLRDIFREIDDPERRRVEEERQQHFLRQARAIASRPQSGQDSPTDQELLGLIRDLFDEVYLTTPFEEDYDPLIERLSFTAKNLDELDPADLKIAWTKFLDECGVELPWPVHMGIGQWYEFDSKAAHAVAAYEYFYSEVRQGRFEGENEDVESCLKSLLYLCRERELYDRARHLCEAIEDYHNDGVVGLTTYAEAIALQKEFNCRAIGGTFESDRHSAEERLEAEHADLFANLHHRTKGLVTDAELWGEPHWMSLEPGLAPLHWSRALEWEFQVKVFKMHKRELLKVSDFRPPGHGQTCSLGQMIFLLNCLASNLGGKVVLAELSGSDFLAIADGLGPLEMVRRHRKAIAHVREEPYTPDRCREFLAAIRDSGWVFKFLASLQPR